MPNQFASIPVFAAAPAKPLPGAPCNGCGVCCLLEPCPLGVLLSGRRHGRCAALHWQAEAGLYRCGAISAAPEVLAERLPRGTRWAAPLLAGPLAAAARRWVAVGSGCDCDVIVTDEAAAAQAPACN
jgi:hypothetical protein